MRIIFMGTPGFAVPSLNKLVDAGYRPTAVATGPDRPRGRGREVTPTPVKEAAIQHGIHPILQPESVKAESFADEVRDLEADLIIVVAFRILPPTVFEAARIGAFNLHGSLLPKYRGAAPINHAIMNGEKTTGVTTFFLREQVDTGSIILQKEMAIGPNETAGEVHDRMMEIGAIAVLETVDKIERGDVQTQAQDDALATPAPKIHRADCEIDWRRSAGVVHNQIRGLSPYPGAWTRHGDTELKIYRTKLAETAAAPPGSADPSDTDTDAPSNTTSRPEAGSVIEASERLILACETGAVEILEIQQQGKRRLKAEEFLRGYPLRTGAVLG